MLWLLLVLVVASSDGKQQPHYDMVSGEHFDDLVAVHELATIRKDVVLVLYSYRCEPQIDIYQYPSLAYLLLLTHNVESLNYVWFDRTDAMDLYKRYGQGSQDCQTAVFFKRGQPLNATGTLWNPHADGPDLVKWAWDKIKVTLTVSNNFGSDLILKHEGAERWPAREDVILKKDEVTVLDGYPGELISVWLPTGHTKLYAANINENNKLIKLTKFMKIPPVKKLYQNEFKSEEIELHELNHHSDRNILILKQPLFVPNFTDTGYKKVKVPSEVYTFVNNIYKERYDQRQQERVDWMRESQVINQMDYRTVMIELTAQEKESIAQALRPVCEEWCKRELEWTNAWGIREYYRGNILMRHVDKVSKHAISIIMQVQQHLAAGDWNLEVVTYDGERRELTLKPGEMLLYESAKLIHARPKVFEGDTYANCFFHYAPVEGWNYVIENGHLVDQDTGRKESVVNIETTLTKQSGMSAREEL